MSEHIEYHRFSRSEGCTYEGCPAKRYYIADGKRFCRLGHEQEGYRQIQQDEDDFNSQGRVTRKKREGRDRIEKVFRGREAAELYLQCFQLILWKQVKWLIDVKGLPAELETVVRDLWAVNLRAVKILGNEGTISSGDGTVGYSSQSEWEKTGTDTDGMWSAGETIGKNMKGTRHSGMPRLMDSLGLCYLGILLLRLPIGLGDLHRWVEREEMVFLRVIREIPKEMRARLPPQYHAALESRSSLKGGELQKTVLGLVISYEHEFEINFPALNAPLIFFKHVRDLCLPLDIYTGARRLGRILQLEFSFPKIIGRSRIISFPEVQIISLILIATKLSQPFDEVCRVPQSDTDPSGLKINWETWQQLMTEKSPKGFRRGEEIQVTDQDVFQMNEKKLDDYLDWYQRTWVDDTEQKLPQQILDLFPLTDATTDFVASSGNINTIADRLKILSRSLIWQKPVLLQDAENSATIKRPGTLYRHYRNIEDLTDKARAFYSKAAENAGLSLGELVRAVYLMERQLQKWVDEEKRSASADQHCSNEEGDDDDDMDIED